MDLRPNINDVRDDVGPSAKGGAEAGSRLIRLPAVIHKSILSHLPNRDIKSLRLTCTVVHEIACLRLHRVFVSAHLRDIQVLHAIADSETFRHGVTELIWDDARFVNPQQMAGALPDRYNERDSSEIPRWFADGGDNMIQGYKRRKGQGVWRWSLDRSRPRPRPLDEQLGTCLGIDDCWMHFQEVCRGQNAVVESGADEAAFRYALQRFPSLQRVTITPAAHGWLFNPVYETPAIRALPRGFVYPSPRGWPTSGGGCQPCRMWSWPWSENETSIYKEQWRGIRVALRVLADPGTKHSVTEFLLDTHRLNTGLNCNMFEHPAASAEYANLCALLRRPGFTRLDLSLAVGDLERDGCPGLRGGHLRAALARAPGLTHLTLRTDMETHPEWYMGGDNSWRVPAEHHVPLGSIVPVSEAAWAARIRHFGLSGFLVTQGDVLALLAALSGELRSVELSFLHFMRDGGDWRGLLQEMRDTLGWRGRDIDRRPDVVIGHELVKREPLAGRAVWVTRKAVSDFLYGDGPNPFVGYQRHPETSLKPHQLAPMEGFAVERDALDPSYLQPYLDDSEHCDLWRGMITEKIRRTRRKHFAEFYAANHSGIFLRD